MEFTQEGGQCYDVYGIQLKGLSHEIDFKNVDENGEWTDLGLIKGCGWFLNFSEAPLIFC
jgi:hypothetical protein